MTRGQSDERGRRAKYNHLRERLICSGICWNPKSAGIQREGPMKYDYSVPRVAKVVAGSHSLCCRHRCHHHPCLCCCNSCCCCHHCRCRPPSMVGCCVAPSFVCHPIRHPLLSSLCNCQHFSRWPLSPITNLCQPLFCCSCPGRPSPLPLPSMVGCWVLPPPSSIPTEPPS